MTRLAKKVALMMKRRMLNSFLLVAVVALIVAGCGGGKEAPVEQAKGIQATVATKPEQPVVGKETEFRVTVADDSGKVEKAKVTMFLEMKEMDHGENQIALQEVEPGMYQGKGTLPMEGIWVAHIRAEKEGQTRTSNVELKVVK
jgi:hypothetical protein